MSFFTGYVLNIEYNLYCTVYTSIYTCLLNKVLYPITSYIWYIKKPPMTSYFCWTTLISVQDWTVYMVSECGGQAHQWTHKFCNTIKLKI